MKQPFFSIIIPAHNEEFVIETTVSKAFAVDWSEDRFEVIVVENGSTDKTFELLKGFQTKHSKLKVLQSDPGVSRARNIGARAVDRESNWIIFLDADTFLEPQFFQDVTEYIRDHSNYVIGTTEVLPHGDTSRKARWWFRLYDWGHKLFHASYAIQLCRTDIARKIKYDESMSLAEDLHYIKDARKFGKFFFVPTKTVSTSTRRFEEQGYINVFLSWTVFAVFPKKIQKKLTYKVTR